MFLKDNLEPQKAHCYCICDKKKKLTYNYWIIKDSNDGETVSWQDEICNASRCKQELRVKVKGKIPPADIHRQI